MIRPSFFLGVVPARAGSKRIPGKNLAPLGGRPLIDHTLQAARLARRLGALVVSTDSADIARHAGARGVAVPELRPAEIAADDSPVAAALRHALLAFERTGPRVDAVVLLQPTSPFRTSADIDRAIALYQSAGVDTVTAVCVAREHPYWCWRAQGELIEPYYSRAEVALGRHALPPAYVENGAIYVIGRELILRGEIYGERVAPYPMPEAASVDIDTPLDLAWAEFLLAQRAGDPDGCER